LPITIFNTKQDGQVLFATEWNTATGAISRLENLLGVDVSAGTMSIPESSLTGQIDGSKIRSDSSITINSLTTQSLISNSTLLKGTTRLDLGGLFVISNNDAVPSDIIKLG
jgi:hypothetical protein